MRGVTDKVSASTVRAASAGCTSGMCRFNAEVGETTTAGGGREWYDADGQLYLFDPNRRLTRLTCLECGSAWDVRQTGDSITGVERLA